MKSLKLLQILILSLTSFILLNIYENINAVPEFNPKNIDEITPSCQIFIDDKEQITFDNLDKLKVSINIPDSSSWHTNLFKISLGSLIIDDKNKKNFDSTLIVTIEGSEQQCNFKSKVRVSGLVKANVTTDFGFSSMDIKLENDNFLGMRSFKLFLPRMRDFDNEIFATTLFKNLGHLSPNTFWKEVSVNEQKHLFLIQEEINSEFLVNNLLRDGPILEANNKISLQGDVIEPETAMFAKITNGKWLDSNKNNIEISKFAIEKLNRLLIFRPDNDNYALNLNSLSEENIQIFNEYAILMNSLDGKQGLNWDDRKFYFEPVSEILHPVYYDGVYGILPLSSKATASQKINLDADYTVEIGGKLVISPIKGTISNLSFKTIEKLVNQIENLNYDEFLMDLRKRGVDTGAFNFNEEEFKKQIIDKILEHQNFVGDDTEFNFNKYMRSIQKKQDEYSLVFSTGPAYEVCNSKLDCEKVNFTYSEIKEILKGEKYINKKLLFYVGEKELINKNNIRNFVNFKIYTVEKQNLNIFYLGDGNFSFIENTLNIIQISEDFKVLIDNANISFNIIFQNNLEYRNDYDRYDNDLLTGCINIYNSELKLNKIEIVNPKCEDGINIVKSYGKVDNIYVNQSLNDSVDLDFSNLEIDRIYIENSQNDCVDLSKGIYKIVFMNLSNCHDKALSAGENSTVDIQNLLTDKSNIGIAVKDSSKVKVNEFTSDEDKFCIQMYRKKTNFGSSQLSITNLNCKNGDIYIGESNEYKG
jgi:hypothetical protein